MKKFTFSLFFACFFAVLIAQNPILINQQLHWDEKPIIHQLQTSNQPLEILTFDGATFNSQMPTLPMVMQRFEVPSWGELRVEITKANFEKIDKKKAKDDHFLGNSLQIHATIEQERNAFFGKIFFVPIRKMGENNYERVTDFELKVFFTPKIQVASRGGNAINSVLKNGDIYKIATINAGIYKLDYNFLKNQLKIAEPEKIDLKTLKLYGNGGGMLPEKNNDFRTDDLSENAIQVIDTDNNGKWNANDYILFYGDSADKWVYNTINEQFDMIRHNYDDKAYYFLKIGGLGDGLRLEKRISLNNTAYTTTSFNAFARYEEDRINLLDDFSFTQGSGRKWFGDRFRDEKREANYSDKFSFPNLIKNQPLKIAAEFAARSKFSSVFKMVVNNQTLTSSTMSSVATGDIEDTYARVGRVEGQVAASASDNPTVILQFPTVGGTSDGWLDFIQINARRTLTMVGDQMIFSDAATLAYPTATFQLTNAGNNIFIWNISNVTKPFLQETILNGTTQSFGAETQQLQYFVAFNNAAALNTPMAVGKIDNQNLHSTDKVDMAIIYHKNFENAANRLAEHHRKHSKLSVAAVRLDQLYNEFSSGAQDISAIRDFSKMVLERNPQQFKYMLLLGDASFDYKNNNKQPEFKHFVPTYETDESLDPITAFPSDDYFALLSPQEGGDLQGALDIAIGRLPANTAEEADAMVAKIVNYETNIATLGDWRNRLGFVADDQDYNTHLRQADDVAERVKANHPVFNVEKIYLDAYPQQSTPGGQRVPAANEAINNNIFKGLLLINYMGHGSPISWSQERVLVNPTDILSWTNFDRLPLFMTATCTFGAYDNPDVISGGERVLLQPKGGGIALYTTVRAVYSSSNERLVRSVFNTVFENINNGLPTIGEILRLSKNSNAADTTGDNARKFTLLGDPAMRLAIPKYDILTQKINGKEAAAKPDTIRALQKVTIEGIIADKNGQIVSNFNGKIFPTIYDKEQIINTLAQDPDSYAQVFKVRKNVLFKGTASVTAGRFQFSFVVPKDINYEYGLGRISYYANDNALNDAAGFDNSHLVIGGTVSNISDNQAPKVDVFMNTESFVLGGITNEKPTLLVRLSDENGINVAGNSVGHDLTAILDENTQNTLKLNDFYESAQDDYTKGKVRYPLSKLSEGKHTIRIKAWDTANNSGEGYTEFIVAKSGKVALQHVLNYPNPFTTHTEFQFEHNLGEQLLNVQVQIFTISGKLIKTINEQVLSNGYHTRGINWDGKDDFGDNLARGVYIYKVKVSTDIIKTNAIQAESGFEKLVILR